MKTKELIKLLNEIDPNGDSEVCINNEPIFFIEKLHSSKDGPYISIDSNVIKDKDEDGNITYQVNDIRNIKKIKVSDRGNKIFLTSLNMSDILYENQDIEIEFDVIKELEEKIKNNIDNIKEDIKINKKVFKTIIESMKESENE